MRSVHQDAVRLKHLEIINESTGIIVQDFAMKFLPVQYRESQSNFYGKRGISWHISVCLRRCNGRLESQTFVHIIEEGLQESPTVVLMMEHVVSTLAKEHPEITTINYRSDNAGCYHSAGTLLAVKAIRERTGVNVGRYDYSEPQGGKAVADRKSAQIKAHVKHFVRQGNDVTTPNQFRDAILSRGGVPGVRVAVVQVRMKELIASDGKLDGISMLNNFEFQENGVVAHKAYGVGPGEFKSWSSFNGTYN